MASSGRIEQLLLKVWEIVEHRTHKESSISTIGFERGSVVLELHDQL